MGIFPAESSSPRKHPASEIEFFPIQLEKSKRQDNGIRRFTASAVKQLSKRDVLRSVVNQRPNTQVAVRHDIRPRRARGREAPPVREKSNICRLRTEWCLLIVQNL